MKKLNLNKIEKFVISNTKTQSPTHGFGHLQRTAKGAEWFAEVFGSSKEEQEIAYLGGLIHDLKRPSSEKVDHTNLSVEEGKKVLEKFNISAETAKKILELISLHREFNNVPLSSQWVFLADKLLEQSGAFLIFRRSYYIGECEDFKNSTLFESTLPYWTKRMEKFSPEKFDKRVRKLADYQYKWNKEFVDNFSKKMSWAVKLAKIFFEYGRQGEKNLEQLIKDYKPEDNNSDMIKKEALDYLSGKKYKDFQKMIKL